MQTQDLRGTCNDNGNNGEKCIKESRLVRPDDFLIELVWRNALAEPHCRR